MGMRQTFLWFVFYFWLLATLGTLVAFYIPWVSGTRVPGRRLGSVPLLKQLGRRNAEGRLGAVEEQLAGRLGRSPELEVLTSKPPVDQVQAHATWVPLSRIVFPVPGMLACVALALAITSSAWRISSPLWAIGVYVAFFHVSAPAPTTSTTPTPSPAASAAGASAGAVSLE
ncbi:hypothetical protein [Streptomyces xinghaiensis]|uniref:hypothetical protein n=1 Tax=Streptomyces xinghaiensis TaxID=1038928 RepID=UPI000592866D|nr:hypothetical protein [Streptomyces xinghaiensis]